MNPSFFGLEGHPFDRATEEGDAFLSDAHGALLAELHAGLKAPHGITLLIGDEGSGKTTLARSFAAELADSATVAYLPTTGPGLRHLLTEIIEQLGGTESAATEEQALLDELTRLARARAEHDRLTLIVLDDAHELPAKTIERLGKLFGDDPAEPSMLHIILVGRGELLDRMNAANDRSILKHLVQVCRMDPIGPEESFRYIADRISKVGGVVDSLFTEDALHLIVKRANGFPARIDAICTASLDFAEGRGDASVGMDAVDSACSGVSGFAIDDAVAPGTASYFLADENEDDEIAAVGTIEDEIMSTSAQGSQGRSQDSIDQLRAKAGAGTATASSETAAPGGRRRLAVWAIGLIGVVGLFAATMSGTNDTGSGAGDGLGGVGSGGGGDQIAALVPEDKLKNGRSVAAEPVAAPKLSLSKSDAGKSTGLKAGAAKAKQSAAQGAAQVAANAGAGASAAAERTAAKKKQILENLQQNATPRRATAPVHASPKIAEGTAPAAAASGANARATSRNAQIDNAKRAAKNAAAAPTQVASARPRVQSPQYSPSPKVEPGAAAATRAPAPSATAAASRKPGSPPIQVASRPTKPAPSTANPTPRPPIAPVVAAPKAMAPKPATPNAAPAKPVARTPAGAPTQIAAAPKPARVENTLPRKYFTVQLGAFGSRANAETLLAKLRTKFDDGRILATNDTGKPVFRVVSGTFTDMNDAKGRAAALEQSGYKTYVRSVGK